MNKPENTKDLKEKESTEAISAEKKEDTSNKEEVTAPTPIPKADEKEEIRKQHKEDW